MQNDPLKHGLSLDALERKHESADPDIRWIVLAAALVVVMTAISFGVVRLMTNSLGQGKAVDSSASMRGILTAADDRLFRRFPGPNLQTDPRKDLATLRAHENDELNNYGWVDRSNGVVRIPIDRAMDLIAERGLPTRGTNRPARTGPSSLDLIRERSQER